jgi:hypothetical protein
MKALLLAATLIGAAWLAVEDEGRRHADALAAAAVEERAETARVCESLGRPADDGDCAAALRAVRAAHDGRQERLRPALP